MTWNNNTTIRPATASDNVLIMASGFHDVHPDKDSELFINEAGAVGGQNIQTAF
jgi:hypothetical protein